VDAPLVPAPPSEVQDLDTRLQALLRGEPEEGAPQAEGAEGSPEQEDEAGKEETAQTPAKGKTPFTNAKGMTLVQDLSILDPWELLDEHETMGPDLLLEIGYTSKKVNAKKLLTNADGLPDVADFEGLSDEQLWSSIGPAANMAPMLAAGNPVESLFLAVAGHIKKGRYETQKAGVSVVWLEFEDLFTAATSKRRHLRSHVKKTDRPIVTPHASDDEASDCEDRGTPSRFATPGGGGLAMSPLRDEELTSEEAKKEEQRKEVALLESMIEDAQVKYEATIRQHLQAMQKDGEAEGPKGYSHLYANVKRWQDQLEPVLKEFESRPEFNIHEYSQKFLTKMTNVQKGEDASKPIPFARLVYGQPRWEICRRFLTCLILTNQGNTDIIFDSEEERLNGFQIKLLNAEKKMISLDGEEAAQEKETTTKGRWSKKALSGAVPEQAHKRHKSSV